MHSPTVRKGLSCKKKRLPSPDTLYLIFKTKSLFSLDNLTETHRTTLVHAWGLDKLVTLLLVKATTLNIRQFSILDKLFHSQAGLKLGGFMYCLGSTKYMWHPTWHFETIVNPPCHPWHRRMNTQPSTVGLPNKQVISDL